MLRIGYTWVCDVCGKTDSRFESGGDHGIPNKPTYSAVGTYCINHRHLPSGWRYIDGMDVCDRHTVVVTRPGKTASCIEGL